MTIIGIIPARFASTRFPGKPLADIKGKAMVQRVYEQAKKTEMLTEVVIATDDERIMSAAASFGAKAVMTSFTHQSGTDRCAEVISKYYPGADAAVNIQGDEPFIDPQQIDELAKLLSNKDVQIATLIKKIELEEELFDTGNVRVVTNTRNEALYFSRATIPFLQKVEKDKWLSGFPYYKHIGIYGYKKDTLLEITGLSMSSLEKAESLEQLRWLENGYKVHCGITNIESISIETQEDLQRAIATLSSKS